MKLNVKLSVFAISFFAISLIGCGSQPQAVSPAKRLFPDENGRVVLNPGDRFVWTANTKLTANEECTLIIPEELLKADEPISSPADGDDDMGFLAKDGNIYFGLRPRMLIRIKTSSEATVQCPSSQPVTFNINHPTEDAG